MRAATRSILANQHTSLSLLREHTTHAPALSVTQLDIPSHKPALFYYGLTAHMADSPLLSFWTKKTMDDFGLYSLIRLLSCYTMFIGKLM